MSCALPDCTSEEFLPRGDTEKSVVLHSIAKNLSANLHPHFIAINQISFEAQNIHVIAMYKIVYVSLIQN